jgi:site-specific recombinase XerD
MTRTDLLVVDALHDALIPLDAHVPALPHASAAGLPTPARSALEEIRDRLLRWEAKYRRAQSEATLKAVRADWQVFLSWCDHNRVGALPLASADLVRFLTDQVVLGKKRATLNRYVNTIRLIHRAAHLYDPTHAPDWKLDWTILVKRLAKDGANAPQQAQPLRSTHVDRILATLGTSLLDLRDAALISLASDTLCREAELAALRVEDITRSGRAWAVDLRMSKTDQEGLGQSRFCSEETKVRVDAWCHAMDLARGYLFVPLGRKKTLDPRTVDRARPLRPPQIARILRHRALRAGLTEGRPMSGHSARVGSAIEMIEAGVPLSDVQYAGGWKSQRMVLHYGKRAAAGRNAMATLRRKQRRSTTVPATDDEE